MAAKRTTTTQHTDQLLLSSPAPTMHHPPGTASPSCSCKISPLMWSTTGVILSEYAPEGYTPPSHVFRVSHGQQTELGSGGFIPY
jgi:hypothetical protein